MITYRREIDGLRALAVLPVILFHAGFETFSGGFVGVDVFFVISGYLITSIILTEKEAGTFSIVHFYERRARRILPALFLVMAVCIPFAWLWLLPKDMEDFSQSLIAVSLFTSNILFWQESGYFAPVAELKPLLHTWSLAVEEQYYVLFPLFVILTWRMGKRWMVSLLAVAAVLSLALAQWGANNEPSAAFFLLPTRGWELAIGAFLAFYLSRRARLGFPPFVRQPLSLVGLILICLAIFLFDKETPFPSVYALVPTIGAALVILFADDRTLAGRVLGSRYFVGIGLISYSAYLWHQPLFAFARHANKDGPSQLFIVSLAILTILLAYGSWRYVEIPFRERQRFRRTHIFTYGAVASLVFIGLGFWGHKTDGFNSHFIENRLTSEQREIYNLVGQHTGTDIYGRMFDDGDCRFWARAIDEAQEDRFRRCHDKYGDAVIVLGDSHAMNMYNIIAKTHAFPFIFGVAQGGCRPHDNLPYCHYEEFDRFLVRHQTDVKGVIFHQSGSYLIKDRDGKVDSDLIFENGAEFQLAKENVEAIARYLDKLSEYAPVVWLGPFVEARVDFRDPRIWSRSMTFSATSKEKFEKLEAELSRFHETETRYRYVSLLNLLDLKPEFLLVGSCITYSDKDHFSECGEAMLSDKIRPTIGSLLD